MSFAKRSVVTAAALLWLFLFGNLPSPTEKDLVNVSAVEDFSTSLNQAAHAHQNLRFGQVKQARAILKTALKIMQIALVAEPTLSVTAKSGAELAAELKTVSDDLQNAKSSASANALKSVLEKAGMEFS